MFDEAVYREEMMGKECKDEGFRGGYWNEEEQLG